MGNKGTFVRSIKLPISTLFEAMKLVGRNSKLKYFVASFLVFQRLYIFKNVNSILQPLTMTSAHTIFVDDVVVGNIYLYFVDMIKKHKRNSEIVVIRYVNKSSFVNIYIYTYIYIYIYI